jgi:hypothetical protein
MHDTRRLFNRHKVDRLFMQSERLVVNYFPKCVGRRARSESSTGFARWTDRIREKR